MYNLDYDIQIGKFKLGFLQSVEINKSVDLLIQTAVITLPSVTYNQALDYEEYIKAGEKVTVQLGYDGKLNTEFEGYVQRVDADDDSLTVNCEDNMCLTRKPVADKELNNTSVQAIAEYCLEQVGLKNIDCTHDVTFEKFVIQSANAFDIFKKLKEETGAQIYMQGNMLHIHPPYATKGGDVVYDFAVNIEKSDLKYRKKEDRPYEVEVEGIGLDGKRNKVIVGTAGGDKRSVKVINPQSEDDLRKRGEAELEYLMYDGYEGSITGWLIPYAEPTWAAKIHDADYEYKAGTYYITAVKTTFGSDGGARVVELGPKVSN